MDGDYETQMRDYDDRSEVEEEEPDRHSAQGNANAYNRKDEEDDDGGDGYASGRLTEKRKSSVSSPLTETSSWKDSSPPAASAPAPQAPVATSSTPHAPSTAVGGRARKMSMKAKQLAGIQTAPPPTTSTSKKSTTKGKQKAQAVSTGSNKRKRAQEDESEEEDEYDDQEDEEVNVDEGDEEEEARFSDEYDGYEEDERPARAKKGRGGAGAGSRGSKAREREKEKDIVPILKRAKFEGNPAAVNLTTAATKRSRTKKLAGEDLTVDIMDDSGTPEPSSIGSPAAAAATEGAKIDTPAISTPAAKKRKLPTIKKLKGTASLGGAGVSGSGPGTGPSTPSSGVGNKPLLPPSAVTSIGAGKPGAADVRARTTAGTDLDLSNPSLYAELFKNVSSLKSLILLAGC
jgi:hypothetical protein